MGSPRTASSERDEVLTHKHALPLLSAADIDFINGLKDIISSELTEGRMIGGLLEAVSTHLEQFEREVMRTQTLDGDQPRPTPLLSDPWGTVRAVIDALDAKTVDISGPGPNDHFEVVLSNPAEAMQTVEYVAGIDAACRKLKEIHGCCLQLVQKRQEVNREHKRLKQPAETTVNDHIRLLRQYNKTKDVGQQLIGLIAENRGVPVGSLYSDQDYGVGSDD
ncbi:hypothetical protein VMCG_08275 [Cytospora schulzeri]|uniref:Swi5-domain-containing protein n=1 Tax=Cytospora schulzeri TaxID=448051 RepID=A0A423VSJ4_9PEZI|nr:hypothetical protein VMCG_08275 [Valsa malicola]